MLFQASFPGLLHCQILTEYREQSQTSGAEGHTQCQFLVIMLYMRDWMWEQLGDDWSAFPLTRHQEYIVEGTTYMRMKFYVDGSKRKGTVHLDLKKVRYLQP